MHRTHPIRRIKLQGKYRARQTSYNGLREVPWLNLSGLWLERAGFKAGDQIEIRVTNHQLVITNCTSHGTEND